MSSPPFVGSSYSTSESKQVTEKVEETDKTTDMKDKHHDVDAGCRACNLFKNM